MKDLILSILRDRFLSIYRCLLRSFQRQDSEDPSGLSLSSQSISKSKRRRLAAILPDLKYTDQEQQTKQPKSKKNNNSEELEPAFPSDAEYPCDWVVFDPLMGVIPRSQSLALRADHDKEDKQNNQDMDRQEEHQGEADKSEMETNIKIRLQDDHGEEKKDETVTLNTKILH
mmetsp:Transcript_22816/g.32655  ORF Transcript_22816/g.32655 Transcript_22816/m.32655 type:complete len:172 (-) Transcript_22816:535-1050(-)